MFDHKLGEYLLKPLIDHACLVWRLPVDYFDREVISYVGNNLTLLPEDFFPADGGWYKFGNQLVDQNCESRPYIRLDHPRFRAVKS